MGVKFSSTGDFDITKAFFERAIKLSPEQILHEHGRKGVEKLRDATPQRSGITADAWDYTVTSEQGSITLTFTNESTNHGFHIAMGIQHGHVTGTGGWVPAQDYINPAIEPVLDEIVESMWRELTK